MSQKIGVLALQGAFAKHIEMFRRLGADVCKVREPDDFRGVTALAVPGGEGTAISKILVRRELVEPQLKPTVVKEILEDHNAHTRECLFYNYIDYRKLK